MEEVSIFWFRRDLRLKDNTGLYHALRGEHPVLPVFIFDTNILDQLKKDDARVSFIHQLLTDIDTELHKYHSGLKSMLGKPEEVWQELLQEYDVKAVYTNEDYEPYAKDRDEKIKDLLNKSGVQLKLFKDQVVCAPGEVLKDDGDPYTVYTPYKNKWFKTVDLNENLKSFESEAELKGNLFTYKNQLHTLEDIGFESSPIKTPDFDLDTIDDYDKTRDYPAVDGTTHLGPHLRFGSVSVRELSRIGNEKNKTFLSELIWREFFMQILYHFPQVVNNSFRAKYDNIEWRNNESEFEAWCEGKTGYPMVDAGMRELNNTGYMHNRVRMVVASFLCKHLLIDWRWGEAYFAEKLLDYDLASNNGNWQWAAGTGCDAAPYFRIFNPESQLKKFDPKAKYIRTWVEDFDELSYPKPIVEHKFARERAIETYKKGIDS